MSSNEPLIYAYRRMGGSIVFTLPMPKMTTRWQRMRERVLENSWPLAWAVTFLCLLGVSLLATTPPPDPHPCKVSVQSPPARCEDPRHQARIIETDIGILLMCHCPGSHIGIGESTVDL